MRVVAHGHHAGQCAVDMRELVGVIGQRQIVFDGRLAAVFDELFRPRAIGVQGQKGHQVVDQGDDGGRVGDQGGTQGDGGKGLIHPVILPYRATARQFSASIQQINLPKTIYAAWPCLWAHAPCLSALVLTGSAAKATRGGVQ